MQMALIKLSESQLYIIYYNIYIYIIIYKLENRSIQEGLKLKRAVNESNNNA